MDALVDLEIAELGLLMETQNQTPDSFDFQGDSAPFTPELFLSNAPAPYAPDADPFEAEWLALQLAPDTVVSNDAATEVTNKALFTIDDGGFYDPIQNPGDPIGYQPPSAVEQVLADHGIYLGDPPAANDSFSFSTPDEVFVEGVRYLGNNVSVGDIFNGFLDGLADALPDGFLDWWDEYEHDFLQAGQDMMVAGTVVTVFGSPYAGSFLIVMGGTFYAIGRVAEG